jgi:hypothetical protein
MEDEDDSIKIETVYTKSPVVEVSKHDTYIVDKYRLSMMQSEMMFPSEITPLESEPKKK